MRLTSEILVLGALTALAAGVALLLYVQRLEPSRRGVFAWLPWLGTGAALHALGGDLGYPDVVWPLLRSPWVYVLVASIGGIAWTMLVQVTADESEPANVPRYFGLGGLGALLPPLVLLIVQQGVVSPTRLVLWVAAPMVAVVVTYGLLVCLGLWLPGPAYFAGFAGGLILFGAALEAITLALAFGLEGDVTSPIAVALATNVAWLGPGAVPLLALVFAVWVRLAFGVGVLVVLEALRRPHPVLAERGLKVATVGTLALSTNTFMLALADGWFA